MLKTTLWRPDTCGCEVEYQWDTEQHPDVRIHTFTRVEHCGEQHPVAVVGDRVEGSEFHKDHVKKSKEKQAKKAN